MLFVGLLLYNEEHRYLVEVNQKESEKRYRELFENLIDVSYRTDSMGNITVISPSVEQVFGFPPEEVTGKGMAQFYRHPSERDDFATIIQRDGQIKNFQAEMHRKDGGFVWVSTNAKTDKKRGRVYYWR